MHFDERWTRVPSYYRNSRPKGRRRPGNRPAWNRIIWDI